MTTPLLRNRTLATAVLAAMFVATSALQSQAQPKIGTVDLQKVFEGYFKKKQADTLIQDNAVEADKVIRGMEDEYKKLNDEYRKLVEGANDQAVSADEREKRRKSGDAKLVELKDIEKNYLQFKRQAGTQIEELKRRHMERLLGEIRDTVSVKAKAGNFTLVFDTGNRFDAPLLLYTNGQNDLTDEVLADLNSKAPLGALTTGNKDEKPGLSLPKAKEESPATTFPRLGDTDQKPSAAPAKPGRSPKKP